MKRINFKKIFLLIGAYFIASSLTQYFVNDSIEIRGIVIGTIVFAIFVSLGEVLFKKDLRR